MNMRLAPVVPPETGASMRLGIYKRNELPTTLAIESHCMPKQVISNSDHESEGGLGSSGGAQYTALAK